MELKDWIARTELQVDPLTLLFWLVTILIVFAVGMAFGRRAQRRIERQSEARRIILENADQIPIARGSRKANSSSTSGRKGLPR